MLGPHRLGYERFRIPQITTARQPIIEAGSSEDIPAQGIPEHRLHPGIRPAALPMPRRSEAVPAEPMVCSECVEYRCV